MIFIKKAQVQELTGGEVPKAGETLRCRIQGWGSKLKITAVKSGAVTRYGIQEKQGRHLDI